MEDKVIARVPFRSKNRFLMGCLQRGQNKERESLHSAVLCGHQEMKWLQEHEGRLGRPLEGMSLQYHPLGHRRQRISDFPWQVPF